MRLPPGPVRAALVACAAAVLGAVAPAAAVEEDSLRAAASFGLFRDEYDHLREPASLSEMAGRHVYTLLGNQGGAGRATLGYAGRAGPGFLGAFGDVLVSETESAAQVATVEAPGEAEDVAGTSAFNRTWQWGAFLGYGFRVPGAPVGLGVGLSWEGSRWSASLARDPSGGPPLVGGTLTTEAAGGDVASEEDGEYRESLDAARAVLGAMFEAPRASVEADLHLSYAAVSSSARIDARSGDAEYHLSGFYPGASLAANHRVFSPGGAVDALFALGPSASLRVLGAGEVGRPRPDQDALVETEVADDGTATETVEALTGVEMLSWHAEALVALHLDLAPLEVRFGVAGEGEGFRAEASRTVTTAVDGAETGATSTRERQDESAFVLSTPVAAEVALSRLWTLRAGARFSLEWLRSEGGTELEGAAVEPGTVAETYRDAQTRSRVDFALGLRFQPVPRFSLDALVRGTAIGEERLAVSLGALFLSAVFHE